MNSRKYLDLLWKSLRLAFRSKFKWVLILFALWTYRVGYMPDAGGGMAKILQVVTVFGMLYYVNKYGRNIVSHAYSRTNMPVKSALWLYTLGVISTLWAFLPQFAFFLSFQNLVIVIVMIWFFSMFKTRDEMERAFLIAGSSFLLYNAVLVRLTMHPALIIHHLQTASSAALFFSYCIAEYFTISKDSGERRMLLKGGLVISILILITSTSSGANVSALFGFALACLFARKTLYATLLFMASGFLFFNQDAIDDMIMFLMPGKTKEIIESGNGRETIWELIIAKGDARPFTGWGFGCAERTVQNEVFTDQVLSDAHSNYIGMYGSLGIPGVALLILNLASTALYSFKRRMRPGYLGIFCATACAILNGYTYGFLSGKGCAITIVYFAFVVLSYTYSRVSKYAAGNK